MKKLDVFAVIHYGNYDNNWAIIDDKCPCCKWDPLAESPKNSQEKIEQDRAYDKEPSWMLGMLWHPGQERGIGAYFQVIHCQECGLIYATHVN